jgi:cell shape-determining protein MreC
VRNHRGESLAPEQVRELQGETEELRRQLGQQAVLLADLERQLAEVTGIQDGLGHGQAQIVIAAVIGFDASPQRDTLTINKGALSAGRLRVNQWVAAAIDPDRHDPHAAGRELLTRQWLIGRVSKVDPYRSWVQLTTDPRFGPQPVRVGDVLSDGQWQPMDEECVLYGLGSGRMQIRHAKADYFESGHTVVLAPRGGDLPAPLSLGQISGSRSVAESPLWYDLDVRPWADPHELAYVYVISTGP